MSVLVVIWLPSSIAASHGCHSTERVFRYSGALRVVDVVAGDRPPTQDRTSARLGHHDVADRHLAHELPDRKRLHGGVLPPTVCDQRCVDFFPRRVLGQIAEGVPTDRGHTRLKELRPQPCSLSWRDRPDIDRAEAFGVPLVVVHASAALGIACLRAGLPHAPHALVVEADFLVGPLYRQPSPNSQQGLVQTDQVRFVRVREPIRPVPERHDDLVLVLRRHDRLELVRKQQVQQRVPDLPIAIWLPVQILREEPWIRQQRLSLVCGSRTPIQHHHDHEPKLPPLVARVAPAGVDDSVVEDLRPQRPVTFGQRDFGPLPDRPDPVELGHSLDRVHDQVVQPRHFRPQPLGLRRRGRKLVPKLVNERPLALVRLLHEVSLELPEVLAGPERLLAEERAAFDQAQLFPPLGGIEYCGGTRNPTHASPKSKSRRRFRD